MALVFVMAWIFVPKVWPIGVSMLFVFGGGVYYWGWEYVCVGRGGGVVYGLVEGRL